MSALSRLPADVRRAVVDGRWTREEADRRRIRDARPVTRAEVVADIRCGFETANMLVSDIHGCHASRGTDPIRWSIDTMKEADKRSMLAAQIEELRRLMRALNTNTAGRTAVCETSAIYASLVSDLKLKQDEERRFLFRYREELDALRREIAIIKKLISEIRGGRLDECDARVLRRDVVDRLAVAETRFSRLEEAMLTEAGKPRKPKGTVRPRKPLTAAQATAVATRDAKRRDRLNDLQTSKREVIAKKDRAIMAVKARLGR